MIQDAQVRQLKKLLCQGKSLKLAALKTGMDEKTARKYRGELLQSTPVKGSLDWLRQLDAERAREPLKERAQSDDQSVRFRYRLALADFNPVPPEDLLGLVDTLSSDEVVNLVTYLRTTREQALAAIRQLSAQLGEERSSPRVGRLAVLAHEFGDRSLLLGLCRLPRLGDAIPGTLALQEITDWHDTVEELPPIDTRHLDA